MAYDNDQYLQSLAGARSSIDRSVANTLAEVGRQQQHGIDQSKLIPGAVTGTNEAAKGTAGLAAGRMMGSLQHYGLDHPELNMRQSVEQGHQGMLNRLGALQGSWDRAAPLISQGFEERGAQQRGRVSLIGQQLHADNDMARSNYIAGRQAEDRDRSFQAEQAQRANDLTLQGLAQAAQLERERIAATAGENQKDRDFQLEQARLGRLATALGVNPLEPQPLGATVGSMFLQYGGLPPGTSVQDIALVTGQPVEAVLAEIAKANDFHNNTRPTSGAH